MSGAATPKRSNFALKPIDLKREAQWLRISAADDLKRIERFKSMSGLELKGPIPKTSKAKISKNKVK